MEMNQTETLIPAARNVIRVLGYEIEYSKWTICFALLAVCIAYDQSMLKIENYFFVSTAA